MKRLLLAGLLVLPLAAARAQQDDAYGSLVGMAQSPDKGPTTETIPPDNAAAEEHRSSGPAEPGAPASFAPERDRRPAARKPAAAKREAASDDGFSPVAVPPSAAPRVWTKFFASLMPPAGRLPSFEVGASTAPRRSGQAPRPATAASAAGSAQGLLELVAAATTPTTAP